MDQFTAITAHTDRWIPVLEADPVRPHISHWERVAANRECFVVHDGIFVKSVLCCAYVGNVPASEEMMLREWHSFGVACFYSVWSFKKGYGRSVLNQALTYIRWNRPRVFRAVTLSPKTELARSFHLSNGARVLQENDDSVNFEYLL